MKKVYIERNKLFKNIPIIMLNNIIEIDENFYEDNPEIFQKLCDECTGEKREECEECNGEGYHDLEPYQFFIIEADEWELERLKSYGITIGHSKLLDKHILPIYDFGTSWSAFSYSKEVNDNYELSFDETEKLTTPY